MIKKVAERTNVFILESVVPNSVPHGKHPFMRRKKDSSSKNLFYINLTLMFFSFVFRFVFYPKKNY